jgi:hypothetical protein
MAVGDQVIRIPGRLVELARRYRNEKTLEVCAGIGQLLRQLCEGVREQADHRSIYGQEAVSKVLECLGAKSGVWIPESTAYAFIRLYERCVRPGIPGLASFSLSTALKLASVRDPKERKRLARQAVRRKWSARRLARAVLEARGYRRPLTEPDPDQIQKPTSRPSGREPERRSGWQPARHPRVALRELARLARRSSRAAAAWLDPADDDGPPVISAFSAAYVTVPRENNRGKLSAKELSTLKSALAAFQSAAAHLDAVTAKLDEQLAAAECVE